MTKPYLYFDYAATMPVHPQVAAKMIYCLTSEEEFGNPASTHKFGKQAKEAVDIARLQVADLINAEATEIVWTSGATEANNLAIKGAAQLYQRKGKHIVTSKTEHPSVIESCQQLEKQGFSVTYLTPEKNGLINLTDFEASLRPDTILVSIMHVNNETGVIQDIAALAKIASERNILMHTDAVQSAGKLAIDVKTLPVDLMSFSAHKVGGPKGIGALYVRRKPRVRVAPQIVGGGQEGGMRSGTLATHQIVGMGEAFSIAKNNRVSEQQRLQIMRDHFLKKITSNTTIFLNTDINYSVPNIINLGFKGIKAQSLMQAIPEIAISVGSACHAKGIEPSHVLRAMGLSYEDALSSVRISLGLFTTQEEIDLLVRYLLKFAV